MNAETRLSPVSLQSRFGLLVKEGVKPVPDFHTVRHTSLSPQQNLALNQVSPIIAMIKTKGRIKESA